MNLSRNTRVIINFILGPLLFVWLSYSLYVQIKNQDGLKQAWAHIQETPLSKVLIFLIAVFLLMVINWLIEAIKWKIILKNVQRISLWQSYKAILSGTSFSITTPNRVGEYAGRVLFLDEGNRLRSVSLTIVCSISQLLTTILMGCLGLVFLLNQMEAINPFGNSNNTLWVKVFLFGSLLALVVVGFFYFKISFFIKLFEKTKWLSKNKYLVAELENANTTLLLRLFLLSVIRFIVFCAQYYLLFRLFSVEINLWNSFWIISITFLVLAIIPSIAIAELGVRGTVTWELMKIFTTNSLGVTITTASIWFINLIIPAIAGSILIAGVKLFKSKKEVN